MDLHNPNVLGSLTGDDILINIGSSETIYVDTAGDDDTGDGSLGNPYATPNGALNWLHEKYINGNINIDININAGHYSITEALNWRLVGNFGKNVRIRGESISKTTSLIQSRSGTSGDYSYILNLNNVTDVTVGDYVIVRNCTNVTNAEYVAGCHEITNVDSGNSRITIHVEHRLGITGALNADVEILRSVLTYNVGFANINWGAQMSLYDLAVVTTTANSVIVASYGAKVYLDNVGISGGAYCLTCTWASVIQCADVAISGASVNNFYAYHTGSIAFPGCISSSSGGTGAFLAYNSHMLLQNSIITGANGAGLILAHASNVRADQNFISSGNGGDGISVDAASYAQLASTGKSVNNVGWGLRVLRSGVAYSSGAMTLTGNGSGTTTTSDDGKIYGT